MTAPVRILDTGLMPARWNVAMTAALVEAHANGASPDTVRFHRYRSCVLLGNSQEPAGAADLEYCRRHGIEIARRLTGGGAVFISPRMLAWDVVIALKAFGGNLGAATRLVCDAVAAGLSRAAAPARFRPPNDIEVGGLKVSGSSGYAHGRSAVLQGTVLIEDDMETMAAALRIPECALRGKVSCLATLPGAVPAIEAIQDRLAAELAVSLGRRPQHATPAAHELQTAERLLRSEVGTDDYVMGRPSGAAAGSPP